MWIDTNECEESWHELKCDDNGDWQAFHNDDSVCECVEFNIRELVEA